VCYVDFNEGTILEVRHMSWLQDFLLRLDDWRVRQHFKYVEQRLRARDVSDLPNVLQASRSRHLDELHRYAIRGVFPRNHERGRYAPCFIDGSGRECAVAHLVMADGFLATAHKVADATNFAYVPDIHLSELDEWAGQSGFTTEELALIQPGYVYDPELRQLLPLLFSFAFSVMPLTLSVQIASGLGVLFSAVNITRLRHHRGGMVAPVIGLALGLCLLLFVMNLGRQVQTGSELLYPFQSMQPPMIDMEITLARGAYVSAVGWGVVGLAIAGLCIIVGLLRLYLTRRWLAKPAQDEVSPVGAGNY
jgi:hypothetical protein